MFDAEKYDPSMPPNQPRDKRVEPRDLTSLDKRIYNKDNGQRSSFLALITP